MDTWTGVYSHKGTLHWKITIYATTVNEQEGILWVQIENILYLDLEQWWAPRAHLAMPRDIFGCHFQGGDATGIQR